MIRTPYDKRPHRRPTSAVRMFAGQGYVVAVQDTRGKFESEGDYTVSKGDVEDGADATTWLATQPWSNGKIGTYGCSYLGDTQVMQARVRNPHHAAMLPQAAGSSIHYRYFGTMDGGAIEMAGGLGWVRSYGTKRRLSDPLPAIADFRPIWNHLPLVDMMKKAGGPPTDWEDFVSHAPGDPWWDELGYIKPEDRFDVPSLQVNSWYDFGVAETLQQFNQFRTNAVTARGRDNQFIIISPTEHCRSETATEKTMVGARDLGDARFGYWDLYLRWFDYWLKGVDNGVTRMPKVRLYVMGRNAWRDEHEWPLARTQYVKYYLHSKGGANTRSGDGTLSIAEPGDEPPDSFVYDPAAPVPSVGGPGCCSGSSEAAAGAFDQSGVEDRKDVLVYSTPPLERGIEVTGPIQAVLHVSSTARDTDFTAKLVDVYPDGTAYNIQESIIRARYRDGFQQPVWMSPGNTYRVRIDLKATSNYFGPGHRIRLEISSSSFPRYDRNLNTGGKNYDEVRWVTARNTIHHSREYASHLVLPIIPEEGSTQQPVVIRARGLIDVETGRLIENAAVVVEGDRIVAAGRSADVTVPSNATQVDLPELTLLPGLIDAHVHLTLAGDGAANARATLAAGFTTVQDLGALAYANVALKKAISEGKVEGPRVVASGPWLGISGGTCDFNGIGVKGPEAFRQRVRQDVERGADLIKVCVTGWVADAIKDQAKYEIGDDELSAAIDEAHKLDRRVAVHALSEAGIAVAVRLGADLVAHAGFPSPETVTAMKERGVPQLPTLFSLSGNTPERVSVLKAHMQRAVAAGLPIAFGTDAGVIPHGANAREFEHLSSIGVDPISAMRAATLSAARAVGMPNDIGVLSKGRLADVIGVEGNPLEDLSTLQQVRFAMKGGKVFKK
jgi:putative CocE/NonD family hydrolase